MKGLTDIPGIRVGHASDFDGLTGCTVVLCDRPAVGGVEIRGSATGTEELDVLSPGHVTGRVDAVVLTGGSAFGLESASGVRRFLERSGVGYQTSAAKVPIVPAAVLYDLGIGKANVRPTREMGEIAAAAASGDAVVEGCIGAGTGATVGKMLGMRHAMKGGIGSGVVWLDGPLSGVRVAALVAVNAVGDVRDPDTNRIVAGVRRTPESMDFADGQSILKSGGRSVQNRENTTLAVVATNAKLDRVQTNKLAQLAALGLARTIYPVHLMADGDVVFALSVGDESAGIDSLGIAAAEAVAQAVVRSVRLAESLGGVPGLASRGV